MKKNKEGINVTKKHSTLSTTPVTVNEELNVSKF
jgi:hypothetical protein